MRARLHGRMQARRPHALLAVVFAVFVLTGCGNGAGEFVPGVSGGNGQDSLPVQGERLLAHTSWYGHAFHGRTTASGEPFDMNALTCAHRDYPFGTLLRISNPETGSECHCTVNDRGPFIDGRDLDLSYAAAKRVDLIGPGTTPLYVEPVGRDTRYRKAGGDNGAQGET